MYTQNEACLKILFKLVKEEPILPKDLGKTNNHEIPTEMFRLLIAPFTQLLTHVNGDKAIQEVWAQTRKANLVEQVCFVILFVIVIVSGYRCAVLLSLVVILPFFF